MTEIMSEIPPLEEKDCFHIEERYKSEFSFPIHQHREMELNFIENGSGIRRIVGDSVEIIGDYELVLISGSNLSHTWEQNGTPPKKMHEITIHFSSDLFANFASKTQFASIINMFKKSERGLAFSLNSIIKVYSQILAIMNQDNDFDQLLALMRLLHSLSLFEDSKQLASSSFAHTSDESENKRIAMARSYIQDNFRSNVTLPEIAKLFSMSPSAFSHYFKNSTGKNLTEYMIEYRLGHATRLLLDTSQNITEICFDSGFNNISNFGRLFKKKYGMTPKEFRALYKKNKITL